MELARASSVEALLVRLGAERDRLVERAIQAFDSGHPALPALPAEERRRGFFAVLPLGLAAVGEDREPTEDELDRVRDLAARRARQGLSLEATVNAYRAGGALVMDEATRLGQESGVPAADLLRLTRRFWLWLEVVATEVADAYHEAEEATDAGSGRADALRGLLEGTVGPAELDATAAVLGLDPGRPYVACFAAPAAGVPAHRLRLALEAAGGPGSVRTDAVDGVVAGLLAHRPDDLPGAVVGAGASTPLAVVAGAAAEARAALDTALAFGLEPGTYALEDLGLLPAVVHDAATGERAVERCFGPFDDPEPIAETLRVLLEADRHVEEAARALEIHPNTLRYRTRRFEEATGLELGRTDHVVLVWWALQRRRLRHASG